MRRTTLRIVAALPAVCLLTSGLVLAEDKSALMRTGDLACNDLCRRWMSLGEAHEPVAAAQAPPTVAPLAGITPDGVQPSVPGPRHVRAAATVAIPPLKAKVVRSGERPRPATMVSGAPAPALHRPSAVDPLPTETGEAQALARMAPSASEAKQSRHRAPSGPVVQTTETEAPAAQSAVRSEDASIPIESAAWVAPAHPGVNDIDPADAELITGALSAGTLLAMALLPLTSRPRRRSNPGLKAVLRASGGRISGEPASTRVRPAASNPI